MAAMIHSLRGEIASSSIGRRNNPPLFANRTHLSVAPLTQKPVVVSRVASAERSSAPAEAIEHTTVSTSPASSASPSISESYATFLEHAKSGANQIPLVARIFSDQLTPVLAYRCLVNDEDTGAPSFLLESVVGGDTQGRYSYVGAHPSLEVVATQHKVVVLDNELGTTTITTEADPMDVPVRLSRNWKPAKIEGLPDVFTGGWVGYCGYDTVRYPYLTKLPFEGAPKDDRGLADMHLALYNDVIVFDQATKIVYAISWVHVDPETPRTEADLQSTYLKGQARLSNMVGRLNGTMPTLRPGTIQLDLNQKAASLGESNMTKDEFMDAIATAKEGILAGDIFQLVISQRFERRTYASPFEVYRSLRVVNPSPYMAYIQARGCILVSSSPEILCKVDKDRIVTNRPLAGTRARGKSPAEDAALEAGLLADEKELSEHTMLVDLGRNDVGRVSESGSVKVEKLMEIERYSHVMHISSTVTGKLLPELDCWDALRRALPAGTVSGAPKVSAMQIIDKLEKNRRGPYGGGFGCVGFNGAMDMALGLRTIVVPTSNRDTVYSYNGEKARRQWVFHLQSGAGLVADSVPESEYQETVNKAAGLGRAVDLAEQAFVTPDIRSPF